MPNYVYKCDRCNYTIERRHSMLDVTPVVCVECGDLMHRVPQVVHTNWGGLPPHEEHLIGPAAHDLINNFDENKDKYRKKYADRGKG